MHSVERDLTKSERREHIQRLAEGSLKDHVLETEGDKCWLCKNPNNVFHYFRVVFSVRTIFFSGDLGDCIIHPTDPNVCNWLCSTLHPSRDISVMDYFLQKTFPHARDKKDFFSYRDLEITLADLLEEERNEFKERGKVWIKEDSQVTFLKNLFERKMKEVADLFGIDEDSLPSVVLNGLWCSSYLHVFDGDDPPSFQDWSNDALWCFFALRKFVSLYLQTLFTEK